MLRSRSRTEVHCSVFRSVMVISLILYRCYRHVIDVLNCQKLFCLSSHKGPSFKPTSSARSWWRFSALHPTCCSWTHWLWMCHSHIKKVESKYILGSHTEGDKDAWEELYIYIHIYIYTYIHIYIYTSRIGLQDFTSVPEPTDLWCGKPGIFTIRRSRFPRRPVPWSPIREKGRLAHAWPKPRFRQKTQFSHHEN